MILLILTWNEVKDSRKIPKTDVSMQKKAQIFSFTITFQQMDSQRLWSIGWTDKSKVIFLKQHFLSSSFSLGSQCCFILIPFLYLLYETWLSMTFPKFLLEILWVKFCLKWLCRYGNHAAKTYYHWKILKKINFLLIIFILQMWNLVHGRNIFRLIFFLIFMNHQCYSNCFNRNQRKWISGKTAKVSI